MASDITWEPFSQFLKALDTRWPEPSTMWIRWPHASNASISDDDAEFHRLCKAFDAKAAQVRLRLRKQRNLFTKVNYLPENILCMIFQLANESQNALESSFQPPQKPLRVNPLLSISQTCTVWRTIALKNPYLWSSIDFASVAPEVAELWARRSGTLPLSIAYRRHGCVLPNPKLKVPKDFHLDFCMRYLSRAQNLHITFPNFPEMFFNKSADMLESLTISDIRPPFTNILPDLFSAHPRLSSLKLYHLRVEWSSNLYTNLKHLDLFFDNDGTIEDTHILAIFRNSPFLETLCLMSTDLFNGAIGCDGNLIPLRHLRNIAFALPSQNVSFILSSIETSRFLHSDIAIVVPRSQGVVEAAHYARIELPSDPRCLPSFSVVKALSIDFKKLQICGKSQESDFSISILPDPSPQIAQQGLSATLEIIHSRIPFPILESFELCGYDPLANPKDVCLFLSRIPSIVRLKFEGCPSEFFKHMQIWADYSPVPFCPNVQEVVFCNMTWEVEMISVLQSLSKSKKLRSVRFEDLRISASSKLEVEQLLKAYHSSSTDRLELIRVRLMSTEETGDADPVYFSLSEPKRESEDFERLR